jgi:hypothetical protein
MHILSDFLFDCSATCLNRATNEFAAQIFRLASVAKLARLVFMDITLRDFTWPPQLTTLSKGSDATILMSAAKESLGAVPIRTASILTDLTSVHVPGATQENLPDVFKCPACVPMEQSVIEMLYVNMLGEIDLGTSWRHKSHEGSIQFESFFNLDANAKWDGLAMDISARLTKILMDGRITISAVMIHDAVPITASIFPIRDRWV